MSGGLRGSDGLPLPVLGIVALAAIPLSIGAVVLVARPLNAILNGSASATSAGETAGSAPGVRSTGEVMEGHLALVNGRSLFTIPPPPAEEPEDRGPAPAVYGGPALIAMIDGAAWFQDGTRAEQGGAAENGVRVIELRAPWGAKVEWEGGTYDVELFKRTDWKALRDSVGAAPPSYFGKAAGVRTRRQPGRGLGTGGAAAEPVRSAAGVGIPPGPGANPPEKPAAETKDPPKPAGGESGDGHAEGEPVNGTKPAEPGGAGGPGGPEPAPDGGGAPPPAPPPPAEPPPER